MSVMHFEKERVWSLLKNRIISNVYILLLPFLFNFLKFYLATLYIVFLSIEKGLECFPDMKCGVWTVI